MTWTTKVVKNIAIPYLKSPQAASDADSGRKATPLELAARSHLDEGESRSGLQRLVLVLHLEGHVLLHPFLLVHLPLGHHVEEGARRHGDGDGVARLGLVDRRAAQMLGLTTTTAPATTTTAKH